MEQIGRFIHNLRQRPVEHRRHILHVSTFVCIVLFVFIWFFSLSFSLTGVDNKKEASNDVQPVGALRANFLEGYKSISEDTIPEPEASDLNPDMLE